ncbi:helicase-related protein [Fructobacillus evanidus]|uniref:Superfamily II DNA/RNA helicase required for DNA uptake (Late competence protein) (ComFA) n=1 Tax=Fructobacillus evanidus TaxID=3064281 RepID=A0ABM9MTH9_9LACO|nr:Superfamily II DNA/RNA helicase required for DNA uptake (late competence protein) (ComFA) [Fructobacillus sp. LMG 32999]CAK1235024.1 Superfamily II DNA/RNA helicase required for DNA uptake (late competence protein) (ComFA) [Fructobacillus sp. LMG 32999]CAK1235386.1 Superfamily II DNA/RNA helicase required for DNA uptake (late competence protein) (ComFA) [Fructobacillus sp. LMG 32999]CAK1239026.1 Superfamily II DNA/RNA helicase required for DNA uptake (late competence protein) (ComFA) [Fructob
MGRVSTNDCLLTIPEPNLFQAESHLRWSGQLTNQQEQVSQELMASYDRRENRLVWAVTGAGKTEMLFPLIDHALQGRGRVAILTPRVDVVLELAPRLEAAFDCPIQVLYGQHGSRYRYSQLVLATTHQALRFYRAFDLLIIDEVDAFPFRGDTALSYAVLRAQKNQASVVYLTATPTADLRRLVKQKKLAQSYLPQRFHQGFLPQIQVQRVGNWRKHPPKRLLTAVQSWVNQQNPFLVFVPRVKDLVRVFDYLQKFQTIKGATVHAADPDRAEKVRGLRSGTYRYLVTTTILERGVTLPALEVVILGADDSVFSTAALVQIAGRVGRSKDYPDGLVLALVQEPTLKLRMARQQIADLNNRAKGMASVSTDRQEDEN